VLPSLAVDKRWLLGGLLIAGGIGLVAVASSRPKINEKSRVLLFGDSLAVGLNPHLKQLADEAGVEAYTGKGIVGTRLNQWDTDPWLDATLASFQPNLILVSLGTNDEATSPGAVEREADAFHALLDKLRATGAEIVWIGPPELPFPRQGVADMIRESVPYYFESEQLDIPRAGDHLHPNAAGYAGWAGAIWRWLT
jgi:lysophospholipase L1-like esterase